MVEPTSIHGLSKVASTTGAATQSAQPGAEIRGARFQALLEELELRSQAMAKSAREPLSAQELPAAVEGARASLEDALKLSQDLLEACRQSAAQNSAARIDRP